VYTVSPQVTIPCRFFLYLQLTNLFYRFPIIWFSAFFNFLFEAGSYFFNDVSVVVVDVADVAVEYYFECLNCIVSESGKYIMINLLFLN